MIGKDSRYARCVLYRAPEEEFLGARPPIDTAPRPDDRFHTAGAGDRIDLLAAQYLGDASLWWIICDYNDIFYPLELESGTVLRIPSAQQVQMRILG